MSAVKSSSNGFASALCDALGLKRVTKLTLTFEVDCVPKVDAICLVTQHSELVTVLRRFELDATEVVPAEGTDAVGQAS